jgi:GNAT superfamily N-acetyltransferase
MANASVSFKAVPVNLPRHPIGTILIDRLAVDRRYRGQRLGEFLLFDALRRALEVSHESAAFAVEVDAYPSAIPFYTRYGFTPFLDQPGRLYLPMKQIARMGL